MRRAGGDGEKDPGDDERGEGEAHRPGSFASAPASPALVPGLVVDERVSRRKLLDAVRKHAPLLAQARTRDAERAGHARP